MILVKELLKLHLTDLSSLSVPRSVLLSYVSSTFISVLEVLSQMLLHSTRNSHAKHALHNCPSRMIFTSNTLQHNDHIFAPHPVNPNAYACKPFGCAAAQL